MRGGVVLVCLVKIRNEVTFIKVYTKVHIHTSCVKCN